MSKPYDLDALLSDDEPTVKKKAKAVPKDADTTESPKSTQAETLVKIVEATGAIFFHTDRDEGYVAIPINGHYEIYSIDGKPFRDWLNGLFYKETGRSIGSEAIKQVLGILSAKALYDSDEEITLHTRLTGNQQGIWYDLTNPVRQAVYITPNGWEVSNNPPIMFRRYQHQAEQVMPMPGGDVRKLLDYIPIKNCPFLFLCWIICAFVPGIPHAMLVLFGEKGAAKSTSSEFTKGVIDPSVLKTLTLSNDSRTLAVNFQQHFFLPFDNVSHIDADTSDFLCRVITGAGIQQRTLYTNDEATVFNYYSAG